MSAGRIIPVLFCKRAAIRTPIILSFVRSLTSHANLQENDQLQDNASVFRIKKLREENMSANSQLNHPLDLRYPSRQYPLARRLKRKVYLHIGPTNSGKSHTAIEALKQAKTGWFAGPLRMLAREVYERLKNANLRCNLVTGDEIIEDLDELGRPAPLSCGTVEMTSLTEQYDVAIIDEIQMIGDPDRGWAWTEALLGLRAKEIHLCGDPNSEGIVRKLMDETGDELIVKKYERLSGLVVEDKHIPKDSLIQSLMPKDCIVCFTKKTVLQTRDRIVQATGKKCAVIHGGLPPEVRAEQARMFNDPDSDVEYLVSTDAIGMGLNLAIARVIFSTIMKFDGEEMKQIAIPQIKQIAGRAGRFKVPKQQSPYSSDFDIKEDVQPGLVTALDPKNLEIIRDALKRDSEVIQQAVYSIPDKMLSTYLSQTRYHFAGSFNDAFAIAMFGPNYTKKRVTTNAPVIYAVSYTAGLTLTEQQTLVNAPVSLPVLPQFEKFCAAIAHEKPGSLLEIIPELAVLNNPTAVPITQLEEYHKTITLFLWLRNRFPGSFLDAEEAIQLRSNCELKLNEILASTKAYQATPGAKKKFIKRARKPQNSPKLQ